MKRHFSTFLLFIFLVTALSSTACVYESEYLNDLKCSPDGKRQGDALCIDGLWIYDPVDANTSSDVGNIPVQDVGSDVAEPPLDSGNGLQDIGTDASGDTSPVDSGNNDTSNNDTSNNDTGQQDTGPQDVDTTPPLLEDGKVCEDSEQCISGYCDMTGFCGVDLCQNGVLDNGEVDIDCGGTCAQQCGGYKHVAAGGIHTCAIRNDDSVRCWGAPNQLIGVPPATEKYKELTAGDRFVCGILRDSPAPGAENKSNVRCWGKLDGADDFGIFIPKENIVFEQISAGQQHVCGISEVGKKLHCWGNNASNRSTPSSSDARNAPEGQRVNDYTWKQVHAGEEHTCAVAETPGVFRCWGSSANNRRYIGSMTGKPPFARMVAGDTHTCAVNTSKQILCFSNKGTDAIQQNIPQNVVVDEIDSRTRYACIIKEGDASLACWGDNREKRVGDAPTTGQYSQVSTGWEHGCVLSETGGQITCWGNRADGRYPDSFAVQ